MLSLNRPVEPFPLQDRNMDDFYDLADVIASERKSLIGSLERQRCEQIRRRQSLSNRNDKTPIRHFRGRQMSSSSQLRLAELAKQHVMAMHTDNWREDMLPVRFHIPMQHVIGSLRRDRHEAVQIQNPDVSDLYNDYQSPPAYCMPYAPATPADSEDSFLHLLRSPVSQASSLSASTPGAIDSPDADHRFTYQSPEHVAKDISTSALPGLNMALNVATITATERDLFTKYAPEDLEDPQMLMDEVLKMRKEMTTDKRETAEEISNGITEDSFDADSQHSNPFDEFMNFNAIVQNDA